MFGKIIERGFNEKLDRNSGQLLLEPCVPFPVVGFSAGKRHCFDGALESTGEVRRGQFDDAPNSAGSKVVVDDDELQCA